MMNLPDKSWVYHTRAEDSEYETVFELRSVKARDKGKDVPVFLRRAKDTTKRQLWQLLGYRMNLQFATFAEAKQYCKKHGLMK